MRLPISLLTVSVATALGVSCARIPSVEILAAVKVVSEEALDESKFEYLGIVEGESFLMGIATATGEGNAIATCKGKAHKLGASHIVIVSKGGVATTRVVAKAYRQKAKI